MKGGDKYKFSIVKGKSKCEWYPYFKVASGYQYPAPLYNGEALVAISDLTEVTFADFYDVYCGRERVEVGGNVDQDYSAARRRQASTGSKNDFALPSFSTKYNLYMEQFFIEPIFDSETEVFIYDILYDNFELEDFVALLNPWNTVSFLEKIKFIQWRKEGYNDFGMKVEFRNTQYTLTMENEIELPKPFTLKRITKPIPTPKGPIFWEIVSKVFLTTNVFASLDFAKLYYHHNYKFNFVYDFLPNSGALKSFSDRWTFMTDFSKSGFVLENLREPLAEFCGFKMELRFQPELYLSPFMYASVNSYIPRLKFSLEHGYVLDVKVDESKCSCNAQSCETYLTLTQTNNLHVEAGLGPWSYGASIPLDLDKEIVNDCVGVEVDDCGCTVDPDICEPTVGPDYKQCTSIEKMCCPAKKYNPNEDGSSHCCQGTTISCTYHPCGNYGCSAIRGCFEEYQCCPNTYQGFINDVCAGSYICCNNIYCESPSFC